MKNQLKQSEIDFILNAMYWERIITIVKSTKCSLTLAKRKFHAHNKTRIRPVTHDKYPHVEMAREDIRSGISYFMCQLVNVNDFTESTLNQYKKIDDLAKRNTFRFSIDLDYHVKYAKNLSSLLLLPSSSYLALSIDEILELPYTLRYAEKPKILQQLLKDPFFGATAKINYDELIESLDYRDREAERKSKLPWDLRPLQDIGDKFPWICTVLYPYKHPAAPHLPDNLIVISADGSPCFRVEVMDPGEFSKFRMYEVLEQAEYWFDFSSISNRQITDYDFDLDGFKKMMQMSLKKNWDRIGQAIPS